MSARSQAGSPRLGKGWVGLENGCAVLIVSYPEKYERGRTPSNGIVWVNGILELSIGKNNAH
jgi:hypothetical protein